MKQPLWILAALCVCISPVDAPCQTVKAHDSLGVRLIETGARLTAPVLFSLSASPVLSIGGLLNDPSLEFDAHNGAFRAVRLSNGNIVIADRVRLQMFDASGKRVGVFGREGSGPQEYRGIVGLCATRGDTVVVSDRNRRMSVLDGSGRFLRSFVISGYPPERQFCFPDGGILVMNLLNPMKYDGRSVSLTRVALDGAVIREFGTFDWGPFDQEVRRAESVVPVGSGFYLGHAIRNEVTLFNAEGRPQTIIRMADQLQRISDADLQTVAAPTSKMQRSGGVALDSSKRTKPASQLNHKTWPAYGLIEVDPAGRIWVQDWVRRRIDSRVDVWTALNSNGAVIGRLEIPLPATNPQQRAVIGFGENDVMFREVDDDGAFRLVVHRIITRATPR